MSVTHLQTQIQIVEACLLYRFKPGWRWIENSVKYCKRWEQEDSQLSGVEISKRIIHGTMQGLETFLDFTMETPDDFQGWLPTLDTSLQVMENNQVVFKFFEKPMTCNTTLNSRTAMAEDAKIRSLTNELQRRMLRTSEALKNTKTITFKGGQKNINKG